MLAKLSIFLRQQSSEADSEGSCHDEDQRWKDPLNATPVKFPEERPPGFGQPDENSGDQITRYYEENVDSCEASRQPLGKGVKRYYCNNGDTAQAINIGTISFAAWRMPATTTRGCQAPGCGHCSRFARARWATALV